MQHSDSIRQFYNRRPPEPCSCKIGIVSNDSKSLEGLPAAARAGVLVQMYVGNCLQGREQRTESSLLLVASEPGWDLPDSVSDIRMGAYCVAVKCDSTVKTYRGARFVLDTSDQPWLAKQGPDTYVVNTEVSTSYNCIALPYVVQYCKPLGTLPVRCH